MGPHAFLELIKWSGRSVYLQHLSMMHLTLHLRVSQERLQVQRTKLVRQAKPIVGLGAKGEVKGLPLQLA